jgi:hypothetical protein
VSTATKPSVTWVVQTNLGSRRDIERIQAACTKLGLGFVGVQGIPFSETPPETTVEGPAVAYGSANLMRTIQRSGMLRPGVFFDDELFRFARWAAALGPDVLNAGARVTTLRALAAESRPDDEQLFLRPDDDQSFAGTVMRFDELRRWVGVLSPGGFSVDVDAPVVAAHPFEIDAEWRLFIVAGRISSASRYRTGGGPDIRPDLPEDVAALALSAVARFSPSSAFVLDIAASQGRLAVVEYNGMNSSGFYACDIEAIVRDVSAMVRESP